ncbi:MAG: amidohydrolase [Bacillota bacterium]
MFDILFSDVSVITMDRKRPVLYNAFVGVTGKTIGYVGEHAPEEQALRTVNGSQKLLMPGLVNSHAHTAMCALRGAADDYSLEEWLFQRVFPMEARMDERAVLAGVRLGYAEALAAGITSITEMYFHIPKTAQIALDCGLRTNICNAVVCFDPQGFSFERDRSVMETREMLRGLHGAGDGRIRVDAGIHAEYTSVPEVWRKMRDLALENGLRLQMHLSETKAEHERCIERYGKTPARVFYDEGIFDVPTTAAHCVYVTEQDMELLSEKGVTAAYNPISNLKLASGIAPAAQMLKKGVNVAIGSDGCCSNNTLDLFAEMKTGALLQKGALLDPTALNAWETLELATLNGARAQGRESKIGRVEQGMEADLILIDLDKPHLTPSYDPVGTVVYCARGSDVEMTMVQGKVLYEKGEYKTLDIERILHEVRTYCMPLVRGVFKTE